MPDRFSLPLIIDNDGKGDAHIPARIPCRTRTLC